MLSPACGGRGWEIQNLRIVVVSYFTGNEKGGSHHPILTNKKDDSRLILTK